MSLMEYCPSTFNSQIKETTYNSGNLNLAVKSHYSSVNNTKKAYYSGKNTGTTNEANSAFSSSVFTLTII
jgi:hypothetical protein